MIFGFKRKDNKFQLISDTAKNGLNDLLISRSIVYDSLVFTDKITENIRPEILVKITLEKQPKVTLYILKDESKNSITNRVSFLLKIAKMVGR